MTSDLPSDIKTIIAWLVKHTGDVLAPAYYWSAAAFIGLIAMTLLRESAPGKREPSPPQGERAG